MIQLYHRFLPDYAVHQFDITARRQFQKTRKRDWAVANRDDSALDAAFRFRFQ